MKFFMSVDYLINAHKNERTLIFDLDNTLYDESTFLFNAYSGIADLYEHNKGEVYKFLVSEFNSKGRSQLFDKLITTFPKDNINIKKCLDVLRNYSCECCISIYPWVDQFIEGVGQGFIFRIITNGNAQQQQNKIRSLNLPIDRAKIEVIFANDIAMKPKKMSFFALNNAQQLNSPIYVGDSDVDRKFCQSLDIEFYDVSQLL